MTPYLTVMRKDAPQWEHARREVFNGMLMREIDGRMQQPGALILDIGEK